MQAPLAPVEGHPLHEPGVRYCMGVLNWDDLKVFLSAYREGSIGRAAEALGVSGSTVSRRLTALEDALGHSLFVRSPDGLKPTAAGIRAWEDAQEAERSVTRMQAGVGEHDDLRGTVRISLSSELLYNVLLPKWPGFSAAHPNIAIEFVEGPRLSDLDRWEADLAIRSVRPESGDNLVITRLRESGSALFGSRSLLEARGVDPSSAEALEAAADSNWDDWPWVDWAPEFDHLPLARARAQLIPRARTVMRLTSLESIRLAACSGIGLAFLPRYFGLLSPTLVELPRPSLGLSTAIYLVGHAALRNTARVDAVWTFLVSLLRGDDDAQLEEGRAAVQAAYGVTFDTER
ncbi:MAG: LysR family transcriptional regulator [Myxococcota bacterium]